MYRLLRLFSKVRARSRRCSSFPNRTRCRWAPVWFLGNATSPVSPLAPRRSKLCIACSDFFQKSERAHAAAPPFQTGPAAAGLRFGFWGTLQVLYRHSHHVGASFVSLAPTFFKSQSALTPLLLLSKPDPLWLGSGLVFGERHKSCIATRTTSEQALYRLLRFFIKIRARLRRCSSFPNRTRCRWAPVWFFCCIAKSALLRLIFLPAASK